MDVVRSVLKCAECELAGPGRNHPSLRMVVFVPGPPDPSNLELPTSVPIGGGLLVGRVVHLADCVSLR